MTADPLFLRAEAALRRAEELVQSLDAQQFDARYGRAPRNGRDATIDLLLAVHPYIVEEWMKTAYATVRSIADMRETIIAVRSRRGGVLTPPQIRANGFDFLAQILELGQ